MTHHDEATIQDVLEAVQDAIQTLTIHMDERFSKIDDRFTKMDERLTKIENAMVTKDYLDEKLVDLRADIVGFFRKENQRTNLIVDKLQEKNVLTGHDVREIDSVGLFLQRKTVV